MNFRPLRYNERNGYLGQKMFNLKKLAQNIQEIWNTIKRHKSKKKKNRGRRRNPG